MSTVNAITVVALILPLVIFLQASSVRIIILRNQWQMDYQTTVKPVLNGISRDQNIFPLKPGFRLIKVHYI